jgi:1-acyl-sn-glycerol-3-phosphate acyltransferase
MLFRARVFGAARMPGEGAVLLLSNHQSHLDPLLIGMSCQRQLNFLARQTLFDTWPLGALIRSFNGIPIDRDGTGLAGLKETMRRLKRGEVVVLFPEGTRTPDGEVRRLKPGFCTLARRCKVTLQPMAIEGAFAAWPKGTPCPLPHPVTVVIGEPIPPERVAEISTDAALVQFVEAAIRHCHQQAREQIEQSTFSY